MIRLLTEEIAAGLKERKGDERERKVSIATGLLAAPYIREYVRWIEQTYPNVCVQVHEVRNQFFGEKITVAGLLTGQDLREQLRGKDLGEQLLLSSNMFRSGEEIFLDDVNVHDLERELQVPITVVDSGGEDFLDAVLGDLQNKEHRRRQIYEQTSCSNCRTS